MFSAPAHARELRRTPPRSEKVGSIPTLGTFDQPRENSRHVPEVCQTVGIVLPDNLSMARKSLNCGVCGSLKEQYPTYSRCRECARAWGRNYYHKSAERRAKARSAYVRRKYGLAIEELERMLDLQENQCAICHRHWSACPPAKRVRYERTFLQHLCVDHDHRTGRVRALLCNACNTVLGLFEEDLERFASAIAYLRFQAI